MYTPRSFREEDLEVLHDLIRRHSFGTLISNGESGPWATHIPFELVQGAEEKGSLMCHVARANPHWRALVEGADVLAAFLGPHAYVSPSWYADPVTVPTWNYAAVHVYGKPTLVHDPQLLRPHVLRLSRAYESHMESPWDPALVEPVMQVELKAIVGIVIPIERIEGKFKFNQNRSLEDQLGVAAALERHSDPVKHDVARLMRGILERNAPG